MIEKYLKLAEWNYKQMNFSDKRAAELAQEAIKVWFPVKKD